MAFSPFDELRWNENVLRQLLNSPRGPIARDLSMRAIRVQNQAKINASGRPGPKVRTGRLRSSISWRIVELPGGGLRADIGTNVPYGRYLETGLRNGRTYKFLTPALSAARV